MKLHQMHAGYAPLEDRLRLKISTLEGQDFAFWLTRRVVMAMFGLSEQALVARASAKSAAAADPALAAKAIVEFEREAAVSTADFITPFKEDQLRAAREERPVLVKRAEIAALPDKEDAFRITFVLVNDLVVSFTAPASFIHRLRHLVAQALKGANWGLELSDEAEAATPRQAERARPN
jgi:hypothetical protein